MRRGIRFLQPAAALRRAPGVVLALAVVCALAGCGETAMYGADASPSATPRGHAAPAVATLRTATFALG